MRYKKFDQNYVVVLEKGEKVIASLREFAAREKIMAGSFTGIGGVTNVALSYFSSTKRAYDTKVFGPAMYELVNVTGNFSLASGEPMIHAHATIADKDHKTYGGHLTEAEVAITVEIMVTILPSPVTRTINPEFNLKLLNLQE
ncbi:DNA-binding protein [Candidatus Woesearchaeota archaeon]|nr:DNA-binding protein [Candidatus Woesearchaeota archaeon]